MTSLIQIPPIDAAQASSCTLRGKCIGSYCVNKMLTIEEMCLSMCELCRSETFKTNILSKAYKLYTPHKPIQKKKRRVSFNGDNIDTLLKPSCETRFYHKMSPPNTVYDETVSPKSRIIWSPRSPGRRLTKKIKKKPIGLLERTSRITKESEVVLSFQ